MLYPVSPLPPLSSLLKAPGQEPCFLVGSALSWAVFWRKRAGPGPFREHGEGQFPEGEMEGRVRWVGAALQGPPEGRYERPRTSRMGGKGHIRWGLLCGLGSDPGLRRSDPPHRPLALSDHSPVSRVPELKSGSAGGGGKGAVSGHVKAPPSLAPGALRPL